MEQTVTKSAADNIYTLAAVDLDDNTHFTFVQDAPLAPGDVGTNLTAWYKADAGVWDGSNLDVTDGSDDIVSWQDQSGNEWHGSSNLNNETWLASSINNQPAIDLDGASDYFDTNLDINEASNPDLMVFAIARSDAAVD